MKTFYWTGICHDDRNAGIKRIQECINKYGFIIEHKFFSDLSVSMNIEIDKDKLKSLYDDLAKIIEIKTQPELTISYENNCIILFNISFSHGEGKLKVVVPVVPG